MRIGILKTDEVRPQFAERFGEYPDMFITLLRRADPSLEFVAYAVKQGQFPADIDEVDAYLITGSKSGVYDPEAWIPPLEDFVRKLVAAHKPLIGICFGHQLIAQALGGKAGKSDRGWGVGVQTWQIRQRPTWMTDAGDSFRLLASHQDQVEVLPEGAEVLAGSDFCPVALYQLGDSTLAMQGHPEFAKAYSHDLIELRKELIGEKTYRQGLASLDLSTDELQAAHWILAFIRQALCQRESQ